MIFSSDRPVIVVVESAEEGSDLATVELRHLGRCVALWFCATKHIGYKSSFATDSQLGVDVVVRE